MQALVQGLGFYRVEIIRFTGSTWNVVQVGAGFSPLRIMHKADRVTEDLQVLL
jgi:hypothetical protein